jgi:hypothetical protein
MLHVCTVHTGRLADRIRAMDSNRDGLVGMEEFKTALHSMHLGLSDEQVHDSYYTAAYLSCTLHCI